MRSFSSDDSVIASTPSQVVDEIVKYVKKNDMDGFSLMRKLAPENYHDFIDLVIPELQNRGLYNEAYEERSLRHKLFGRGHKFLPSHIASRYLL